MLRKIRRLSGSARHFRNDLWLRGSTIPDGGFNDVGTRLWILPSWMVPALPAAACALACSIRKLASPASGPPAQHSTALRAETLFGYGIYATIQKLRVGEGRYALPYVGTYS